MRAIPPPLASHLAEGVTTLCRCWSLVRQDGVALGFTDHDRDLVVGGRVYLAASGMEAAEATAELGFAVGGGEVAGALSSEAITEADILAGRYDDATVEVRLVNWAAPEGALLLDRFSIGEIKRRDGAFVAELRCPTHRFDEERGRSYRATCSADLGDSRCGVDLTAAAYAGIGAVAFTDGASSLEISGLDGFAGGSFTAGRLAWLTGANAGQSGEIKVHAAGQGVVRLELWLRAAAPIADGDTFRVTAGCDKSYGTCRDRFANAARFRGFPHMPGNDFVVKVAGSGAGAFDGGSLFR